MLRPLGFIVFFYYLLMPMITVAESDLSLSIGHGEFEGLNATNLKIELTLTAKGIGFTASADSIKLADPVGKLSHIKLKCKELIIVSEKYSCARGNIFFQQKELGSQKLDFEIDAQPESGNYKVEIEQLKLADALFSVTLIMKGEQWKVFADTSQVFLPSIINVLSPYLSEEQRVLLSNWSVDGEIQLDLDLAGKAEVLNKIELDLTGKSINLSDSQGLYVSEGLTNTLSVEAEKINQNWHWTTELNIKEGQGYGEPIFIDFTESPVSLQAKGIWNEENESLNVEDMVLKHSNIMQLEGKLSTNANGLDIANITIKKSKFSDVYSTWVQPFTVGTAMDNLELSGEITALYQQSGDHYQLRVGLDDVFVHEQTGLFSIDGVSGELGWTNDEKPINSELRWQSGSIYALSLGGSVIKSRVVSSSLSLLEPWVLPILDGELHLNNFSFNYRDDDASTWNFDGEVKPISMESLSVALDWPLLHGQLSGIIPQVAYANHKIKIDGALKVNLFEGNTIIRDLELDQPFGSLPQLKANVSLKGLNLETLTSTFDFGKITGKLDGKIANLRLSNWNPVQFNASFLTPEGDKSRRRISQKAVDNLSQIGGGAAGILQRSFLRFFEDFSYQRLGLSCILRNDVCEMTGVGEAENGYYIVKGGGLPPRINVVGYTRRVDWPDLIGRLKAVSESSGPIVVE